MSNILLGAFANILSCANDRVVDAYCLVAEIAHRRTRLIIRILIFAMDRWTVLSASVSKLLTNFWHGEAPSVTPTTALVASKGNDTMDSSTASDSAVTEDTASVSSSSGSGGCNGGGGGCAGGGGGGGGGGATTVQDVFLAARKKRRNKPAYNRVDREIKKKDHKYRVAVTCNSGNTAVGAAISTSAKPALPETSAVSRNARGTDWKTLDALRTGPSTCQQVGKKESSEGA